MCILFYNNHPNIRTLYTTLGQQAHNRLELVYLGNHWLLIMAREFAKKPVITSIYCLTTLTKMAGRILTLANVVQIRILNYNLLRLLRLIRVSKIVRN